MFQGISVRISKKDTVGIAVMFTGLCIYAIAIRSMSPMYFADTPEYLAAAASLVQRGMLLDLSGGPFLHWVPMMAFLYAPVYVFGISIEWWMRIFNFCMVAIVLTATYAIFQRMIQDRMWSGILATASIFWYPLFSQFFFIESETVFLAGLALSLYFFIHFLEIQKPRWFIGLILASACAALTRYSGLFIIVAFSAGLFFFLKRSLWNRFLTSCGYGLGAVSGLALWFARNLYFTGRMTDRSIFFHAFDFSLLQRYFFDFAASSTAIQAAQWGAVLMTVCVVGMLIFFKVYGKELSLATRHMIVFCVLSAWWYVACIILTNLYLDRITMITARLISPALYLFLLAALLIGYRYFMFTSSRRAQRIITLSVLLVCLIEYVGTVQGAISLYYQYHIEEKEIVLLRNADLTRFGGPLYTNAREFLSYTLRRPVMHTPYKLDRYHLTPNPMYREDIDRMIGSLTNSGLIVYFKGWLSEKQQMPIDDLRQIEQLTEIVDGKDISLFVHQNP